MAYSEHVCRADRLRLKPSAPRSVDLDCSIPVLLVKIGRYPLHHGVVGAIRSLGKLGVPVYAIVESRLSAAACSRYLTGRFQWPTTGRERSEELLAGLAAIGSDVGRRTVALATDDEAAVLVAENADRLGSNFILPAMRKALPLDLATKHTLHDVCVERGIPTATSLRPRRRDEVFDIAAMLGFPLVVKNDAPWTRLTAPGVDTTTIVPNLPALRHLVGSWTSMPSVVMQEYLPRERAIDWIAHAYFGARADQSVIFTGRKLRSWPPHAGVTTHACACANPELVELTAHFCRAVGFRGICDLDWRFDTVSHRYNLVDFNPRLGAQFRLFETENGLDVVRAMHLDLTGREVPDERQVDGRYYTVENLDLPAAVAYRLSGAPKAEGIPKRHRELGWWATDDPLPALAGYAASAVVAARNLLRSGTP